jgi:hypothetical protein
MFDVIINDFFQQFFWGLILMLYIYHEIEEKYLGFLGDYMMVETC